MNRQQQTTGQAESRRAAPQLFAVVLAAGSATRFGSTKQLAKYSGHALIDKAMTSAERLCGTRSVLVTGHDGSAVHAACAPLRGFFVHNDRYSQGIGSSIACGVRAVCDVADGVLLMLADQPLITDEHLQNLAQRWRSQPDQAVASRYSGGTGVPAILPKRDFAALCALRADQGAKAILAAYGDQLLAVNCAEAAIDIDRPSDLKALD